MSADNIDTEEKEDYLDVDDAVPGQNYVCLSFVSPEALSFNVPVPSIK